MFGLIIVFFQGLSPGDNVTIVSGTNVNYFLPVFAAWLCGASGNPLDPISPDSILEEQMRMVPAKIVVCDEEAVDKVTVAC